MSKHNYTHEDFKAMKKELNLTNADLANIIGGLTADSVKSMTRPNAELPKWIVSMIYVWKRQKTI